MHYNFKLNSLEQLCRCLATNEELTPGTHHAEGEQQLSSMKERAEKSLPLEGVNQERIMTVTRSSVNEWVLIFSPSICSAQNAQKKKDVALRTFCAL